MATTDAITDFVNGAPYAEGGNPVAMVYNTQGSGAFGPYQYMPQTWQNYVSQGWTDPTDGKPFTADDYYLPSKQRSMTLVTAQKLYQPKLAAAGITNPTAADYYGMHLLGTGGYGPMLGDPNTTLASAYGPGWNASHGALAMNSGIFGKNLPDTATIGQARANIADYWNRKTAGHTSGPAGQLQQGGPQQVGIPPVPPNSVPADSPSVVGMNQQQQSGPPSGGLPPVNFNPVSMPQGMMTPQQAQQLSIAAGLLQGPNGQIGLGKGLQGAVQAGQQAMDTNLRVQSLNTQLAMDQARYNQMSAMLGVRQGALGERVVHDKAEEGIQGDRTDIAAQNATNAGIRTQTGATMAANKMSGGQATTDAMARTAVKENQEDIDGIVNGGSAAVNNLKMLNQLSTDIGQAAPGPSAFNTVARLAANTFGINVAGADPTSIQNAQTELNNLSFAQAKEIAAQHGVVIRNQVEFENLKSLYGGLAHNDPASMQKILGLMREGSQYAFDNFHAYSQLAPEDQMRLRTTPGGAQNWLAQRELARAQALGIVPSGASQSPMPPPPAAQGPQQQAAAAPPPPPAPAPRPAPAAGSNSRTITVNGMPVIVGGY